MTLYTLENNKLKEKLENKRCVRSVIIYICITLFCALFGKIYTHFGHGVTSNFMTYLFVPSLVGGVLVFILLTVLNVDLNKYSISVVLYNLSIATVSTGFALKGVFEIASTDSMYMVVFWTVSGLLFVGAVCNVVISHFRKKEITE